MGNRQSTRCSKRMQNMLRTPFRYHRITPSDSQSQPLLHQDGQSMVPILELEAYEEKNTALQAENRDLRAALSRLESKLQSKGKATVAQEINANLGNRVNELKGQVLELKSSRKLDKAEKLKQEEAIEKLKRSSAALDDKVKKLSTAIAEMKTASSDSPVEFLSDAVIPQIGTAIMKEDVEMPSTENDIAACLVVLIFLVSILIGINL